MKSKPNQHDDDKFWGAANIYSTIALVVSAITLILSIIATR